MRSYGENDKFTEQQQQSALHTLYHCVENILKLFAPFVPHITEELYSHIFDDIFEDLSVNASLSNLVMCKISL